jgi:hypothetical protein
MRLRLEALAIAREPEPTDVAGGELAKVEGLALGDNVVITADDYGVECSVVPTRSCIIYRR